MAESTAQGYRTSARTRHVTQQTRQALVRDIAAGQKMKWSGTYFPGVKKMGDQIGESKCPLATSIRGRAAEICQNGQHHQCGTVLHFKTAMTQSVDRIQCCEVQVVLVNFSCFY